MSAEENKAIFRRYVEEVGNEGKLELADEIFDRYLAHQPAGSALERGPEDVKRFMGEFQEAFPALVSLFAFDENGNALNRPNYEQVRGAIEAGWAAEGG